MAVNISTPEINIREKLTELEGKADRLLIRPAFSAAGSGTYTATTNDQNISSFCGGTVLLNQGNCLVNGKFTAPIEGLYHFDLKLQVVYSSGYFFSYVFKNSSSIANHSCQFYQTNNVCTLSFVIHANEGDYFEPYVTNNYAGASVSSPLWCGHYIG